MKMIKKGWGRWSTQLEPLVYCQRSRQTGELSSSSSLSLRHSPRIATVDNLAIAKSSGYHLLHAGDYDYFEDVDVDGNDFDDVYCSCSWCLWCDPGVAILSKSEWCWWYITAKFLDFPPNFRLRMWLQCCTIPMSRQFLRKLALFLQFVLIPIHI